MKYLYQKWARSIPNKGSFLIKAQLYDGLDLEMKDLDIEDLMDDINTDVMTPAWVCFDHEPAVIAGECLRGFAS